MPRKKTRIISADKVLKIKGLSDALLNHQRELIESVAHAKMMQIYQSAQLSLSRKGGYYGEAKR